MVIGQRASIVGIKVAQEVDEPRADIWMVRM
jgi:hypothetical protein